MAGTDSRGAALVITGPTAAGKTALGIEVAERLGGEIISLDSRQVYRGMDIGTAKATAAERARVPHHGLDLVDPDERYSAGRYAREARDWIREIQQRGRVPVIVGGTGFYLRALLEPLFREPPMPERARERLRHYLGGQAIMELRRWLRRLDPEGAAALDDEGGKQRVARALEVALLTGRPLTWWQENAPPEAPALDAKIFVLDLPREIMYERINQRVGIMIERGLAEEVERLLEEGYDEEDPGMTATGYRELIPYLAGEPSLDEAVDLIRQRTRRYARRQLTWFRHQLPESSVRLDGLRPVAELAEDTVRQWNQPQ